MVDICFSYSNDMMQREYWSYVCAQFGIDKVYEINRPENIQSNYKPIAINNYSELPNKKLVIAAHKNAKYLQGNYSLIDYVHPKDCIYIFGSDASNLYPEQFKGYNWDSIYIPPSKIEMYSFQAGAIIMYDRITKNG